MPNYGLVVTPTYNPMSYEQYIQPFRDYAQVYNATVDQIDALEMEANQWERLADSDIDAPQYQQYKSYADDLRKYANEIATQGLNSRTRAGLSRMRQKYAKEIKPIEEAFNYRQKMAEEQRKLNPTGDMQYTVDFSNIGLGEIMRNPSLGYSARSLSEIEKSAFEQAQAFSARNITSRHATELGSQYYQILQGLGQEAASEFLKGVQEGRNNQFTAEDLQQLNDLYNQVRESHGLNSPSSPFSSSQNSLADERVLNGMLKGLALKDQYLTDYYAKPSGRDSGSGSADDDIEAIGYSKVLNGKEYTVTYEAGYPRYYDQLGNEYVPDFDNEHHNRYAFTDSQGTKHTIDFDSQSDDDKKYSDRRYGIRKISGTKVEVVDMWNRDSSGKPTVVTQNGKNVTFDRSKQRWNPITKKVEDLEQPDTGKATKKTSNRIFISSGSTKKWVDKIEDAYKELNGGWFDTSFTKKETSTATVKDLIDNYTPTEDEKTLLKAYKYESDILIDSTKEEWKKARQKKVIYEKIIEKLPPDAKEDPENYLIQYENGGDYQFITFPQKNYTVNDNGQLVNVPQQEPDFNANGLGG